MVMVPPWLIFRERTHTYLLIIFDTINTKIFVSFKFKKIYFRNAYVATLAHSFENGFAPPIPLAALDTKNQKKNCYKIFFQCFFGMVTWPTWM